MREHSAPAPLVVYLDNATIMNACTLLSDPSSLDAYKLMDLEAFCQAFLLYDQVRTLVGRSFYAGIGMYGGIYSKLVESNLLCPDALMAGSVHYYIDGIDQVDKLASALDLETLIPMVSSVFPDGGPWRAPSVPSAQDTSIEGHKAAWQSLIVGEDTHVSDSYPIYYFSKDHRQSPPEGVEKWGFELNNNRRWDWVDTFVSQTFFYMTQASGAEAAYICSSVRVPVVQAIREQVMPRFDSVVEAALANVSGYINERAQDVLDFLRDDSLIPIPLPALTYLLRHDITRVSFLEILLERRDDIDCIAFRHWAREMQDGWRRKDIERIASCLVHLRNAGILLAGDQRNDRGGISFLPNLKVLTAAGESTRQSSEEIVNRACEPTVAFFTELAGGLLRAGDARLALERLLERNIEDRDLAVLQSIEVKRAELFPSGKPLSRSRAILVEKMEVTIGDRFENISNATIVNRSLVNRSIVSVEQKGDIETAEALRLLAETVAASGNLEAAEELDSFNEELCRSEPRKAVLKALWSGIVSTLPGEQITDLSLKITKLFN